MRGLAIVIAVLASPARLHAEPGLAERLLEIAALNPGDLQVTATTAAEIGDAAPARRWLPRAERMGCTNCRSYMAARAARGWALLGDAGELEALRARIENIWRERPADADALLAPCPKQSRLRLVHIAQRNDVAGDHDAARALVDRAEQRLKEPTHAPVDAFRAVDALISLAEGRLLLGDRDAALAFARRAHERHKRSIMSISQSATLAGLLARTGDQPAADALWSWIATAPVAHWTLAQLYAEHGLPQSSKVPTKCSLSPPPP